MHKYHVAGISFYIISILYRNTMRYLLMSSLLQRSNRDPWDLNNFPKISVLGNMT